MKTILILALLAMVVTMATAQFDPSEQYQPYPEQQPFPQQQQPFFHPFLQQQLNPCRALLVQRCSSVATSPFVGSQIWQQGSCQVMRQQCCQQLARIPQQLRCPAINSVVDAIAMQQQQFGQPQQGYFPHQQQQQYGQQQFFQPQQQMGYLQPQQQMGYFQPQQQQQGQLVAMKVSAHQTLSAMCNVQIPLYCSTTFGGGISTGIGGL